jgi:hypothetical protein
VKNVRRFALAMACLVPFLGSPAAAANWVYVGESVNKTIIYYDADTIQRSGTKVTVWEKWDHSRDKTIKWREARLHKRYNYLERTDTLLGGSTYYPDGKVESFNLAPHEQGADPVTPETIGEGALEAVCAATAP